MTTTASKFVIESIPESVIDLARSALEDTDGGPSVVVVAGGGEPLRCCLRNATVGEMLILFSYEPPLPSSPYQEKGAVFAHASACERAADPRVYPHAWRGRPQVLRAYDRRGWIQTARVHDGSSPETEIGAVLEDPSVVEIHSRNVAYGCYMFTVKRDVGK